MKKYVFLAFFALIAFVVKAQDESGDLVKEGQQMPAFTIIAAGCGRRRCTGMIACRLRAAVLFDPSSPQDKK